MTGVLVCLPNVVPEKCNVVWCHTGPGLGTLDTGHTSRARENNMAGHRHTTHILQSGYIWAFYSMDLS